MSQPATTEQAKPLTRQEAEATLRRVQDEVARRTRVLSDQEKDDLADEIAREIKAGLNARLRTPARD
jgi:hypothetical protein